MTTVAELYQQVLGREPDAAGLAYWTQRLGNNVDAAGEGAFISAAQSQLKSLPMAEQLKLAPNLVRSYYSGGDASGGASAPPSVNPASALQDFVNNTSDPQQIANKIKELGGLSPDLTNVMVQKFGSNPTSVQTAYNELTTPGSLNRNEWFLTHPNPRGFVIGDPAGFDIKPLVALAASYFGAPLIGEALGLTAGTAANVAGNAVINAVTGKDLGQIATSAITGTAGGLVGDAAANANPFGTVDLGATDKSLGDAGNANAAANAAASAAACCAANSS